MMVPVMIQPQASGGTLAAAPDLPGCSLRDGDEGIALARLRLAIEGHIVEVLLAGRPLPVLRPLAAWRAEPRYAGARGLEVHVNLDQLRAVAHHQRGR